MKQNQLNEIPGNVAACNERRWAMVKMARMKSAHTLAGVATGVLLLAVAGGASALTTTDRPAAILIYPKLVVDTEGVFGAPTETVIQMSNTSRTSRKQAHCFLINANSHCADTGAVCQTSSDCPTTGGFATCVAGWSETDFDVFLTPDQPLHWYASEGLGSSDLPIQSTGFCTVPANKPCSKDSDCAGTCNLVSNNLGTGVPPTPEDPFVGSLKCIEFNAGNPSIPDTTNTLEGEATIEAIATEAGAPDLQRYNAVGLQATGVAPTLPNLQIGPARDGSTTTQSYAACPNILIVNHLFDVNGSLSTDLTLVPCGDDFLRETPGEATAQFLVFNEFEQRFSTSHTVDCFYESRMARIDTSNPSRSIFSVNVSGTLAGQTRIKPVGDAGTGRGLVGVARQLFTDGDVTVGTAYDLHQSGDPANTQPDIITLP